MIIMDFAKALGKVPHRWLLHKLDYCGIEGPLTSGSTHGSLGALNNKVGKILIDGQWLKSVLTNHYWFIGGQLK